MSGPGPHYYTALFSSCGVDRQVTTRLGPLRPAAVLWAPPPLQHQNKIRVRRLDPLI
jgi:hypothetical protein